MFPQAVVPNWVALKTGLMTEEYQALPARLSRRVPVVYTPIPVVMSAYIGRFVSERELKFMFAICHRPSVCRLSVTLVHPTQAIEIFGNVCTP